MNEHLPEYEGDSNPEDIQKKIEWMAEQFRRAKLNETDGTPLMKAKIRCGCHKLIVWWAMYRCLYCGIWFCKECAEQHFGKRRPSRFTDVVEDQ